MSYIKYSCVARSEEYKQAKNSVILTLITIVFYSDIKTCTGSRRRGGKNPFITEPKFLKGHKSSAGSALFLILGLNGKRGFKAQKAKRNFQTKKMVLKLTEKENILESEM